MGVKIGHRGGLQPPCIACLSATVVLSVCSFAIYLIWRATPGVRERAREAVAARHLLDEYDFNGLYEDECLDDPPVVDPAAVVDGCALCTAKVHGLFPTTRRLPGNLHGSCTWVPHPGEVLGEESHVPGYEAVDAESAKQVCAALGSKCQGITCDEGQSQCSLRKGIGLQYSWRQGEQSLLKQCARPAVDKSTTCRDQDRVRSNGQPTGGGDLVSTAVVILAHKRGDCLQRCLESLLSLQDAAQFQFFVSLDDREAAPSMRAIVTQVANKAGIPVNVWFAEPWSANSAVHNPDQAKWISSAATAKIANHYWVNFERVFVERGHQHAIFVEEDLIFSPDFLSLFRSTAWLLDQDPTLACVSAWNDVGFPASASDECRLRRTSYFPGLGFLLSRGGWSRLRKTWPSVPTMGWDYWFRVAFREEGWECIVPEVSRTHHLAEQGSSVNAKAQHDIFDAMAFASIPSLCGSSSPCYQFGDVSYLLRGAYERQIRAVVQCAPLLHRDDFLQAASAEEIVSGKECKGQVKNFGDIERPASCAALVLAWPGCDSTFMWSETTSWGCRCCVPGANVADYPAHEAWNIFKALPSAHRRPVLPSDRVHVMPFVQEELDSMSAAFGLAPTAGAVTHDMRGDHYGVLAGRHWLSGARVLLVDRRSPHGYLPVAERLQRSKDLQVVVATQGWACTNTCQGIGKQCEAQELHFLNTCEELRRHFPCQWCAPQVGDELPAYVSDPANINHGHCLVTFTLPAKCESRHDSTKRLCPCL